MLEVPARTDLDSSTFGRGCDWEGDASMDQERARTLLEEERRRLEQLQASIAADQDRVTADTDRIADRVIEVTDGHVREREAVKGAA